jgi:competence protein ComGC
VKKMNKKAFTLTEMMLVVIILSGLMILILPNVSSTKNNVDETTCQAYQKLVESQAELYLLDHKEATTVTMVQLKDGGYIEGNKCSDGTILDLDTNHKVIIVDDATDPLATTEVTSN